MIGYGAALRLKLFFCKWWYTNLFTNSYIQVSQTLTKIRLIPKPTVKLINNIKSKIFGNLNGTVQFTFVLVMRLNITIVTSCDSLLLIHAPYFFITKS